MGTRFTNVFALILESMAVSGLVWAPAACISSATVLTASRPLAKYYSTLAARPGEPAARRNELRTQARSWYQKSLLIWQDWRRRAVASDYAAVREKQAAAAVAACDQ